MLAKRNHGKNKEKNREKNHEKISKKSKKIQVTKVNFYFTEMKKKKAKMKKVKTN